MKKWIIVGGLILIVSLTHLIMSNEGDDEYNDLIVQLEDDRQGDNALVERPVSSSKKSSTTRADDSESDANLFEVVRSFVYFYYDWNYRFEDRSLYNYVTYDFFTYVQYELGEGYDHSHDEDEDELFYVQDVYILIENLNVYELVGGRSQRSSFNIIVEFDIFYDIPHHDVFSRNVVLRLEVVRDGYRYLINQKTRLNHD